MSFAKLQPHGQDAAEEIVAKGKAISDEPMGAPNTKYLMITDSQLSDIITILAIHQYVKAAKELAVLPELEDFVLRDP